MKSENIVKRRKLNPTRPKNITPLNDAQLLLIAQKTEKELEERARLRKLGQLPDEDDNQGMIAWV
jgi:hypothetical protein